MAETNKKASILVVDDVPNTVEVLQRNLLAAGYTVFTASSVPQAIQIMEATPIDLVITDWKMPRVSGLDLVRHIRANCRDTEVIMVTGYPSIGGAVEAVKTGAEEYLPKPFTDEELLAAVRRAMEKLRVRRFGTAQTLPASTRPYGLIGESAPMQEVFRVISKAATSSATILISGESGTGKELVARAIHYSSQRSAAAFVPVNCGGIPEGLLESELFGYMKGAFTGALESRAGFFQTADGGTIFLDEISETSLTMQVKLLRVLQDQEVYMVGSTRGRQVDVRVLASTNKSLPDLIKKGLFREDLFFRLNVIAIQLPPLRERGDDILLLAHHFARKFAGKVGKPPPQFSDEVMRILKTGYHWPGNVRELENLIHRLVVMCDGDTIDVPDLPEPLRFSIGYQQDLTRPLAVVEAEYIRQVLASVGGNRTRAAEILRIDRKTLREKLKNAEIQAAR
ncbi:MAG TPA: sigma-54 dependent transcriptional regulator [Phycisphaerae bacterium]|jgi:two-component system response regulator HydG|nr:sigma-54-dependent Fis family transcriptional regulator [Phycisphaerae bacterium]HOB76236.1 sigma-54 dependent transcriptional regulator [Phycisphaerae bacterium]HOJ56210.1 sigma-54 dependent transcriptional regulator [Phycisphaerae bacterium]HOL28064.1 sigma-54 dependent transcriptional regulator [Phycisphaerae bacterium]HPP22422.1 sigma-54 dependent transcriptional regulator [Phycisphaerae bacterium]